MGPGTLNDMDGAVGSVRFDGFAALNDTDALDVTNASDAKMDLKSDNFGFLGDITHCH